MGFSIGVLLGVILASFALGAFHLPDSNRPIARLNCLWIQETHERPITVANTAPVRVGG
jgi:hypothetical protein